MESVSPQPSMSNADSSSTNPPSQSQNAADLTEKELPPIINEGQVSSESAIKNDAESSQTTTVPNDVPMNTLNLVDYQQMQMYPQSMQTNMIPPNSLYFQSASSQASEMPAIDTSMYYQPPMFIQPGMPVSSYMPVSMPISTAQLPNLPSQQPSPIIPPRIPTPPLIDTPILSLSPQISLPPDCDPEFASVATYYSAFTQKMYMSGFLNKQNCLNAEGKLFMVHEWTRWYVELIGAVLTFWSVPDEIVALPPDQITPEIIMMIKQTIPNYLNITDSVVDVQDYAKFNLSPSQPPRSHTFLLNTAGCNLYTLQAPSV
ncbi:hypothetical protein BKA69DRAFT_896114 [Paraphysoderma sedebokerense]|nr:hypothetical protein BKA69DRAFT_896114 [Paraphysoderma sedebokerense]